MVKELLEWEPWRIMGAELSSMDILSEPLFFSLSFTFTSLCLVLYLLHTSRETEDKMTQIGGTEGAEVKKKKNAKKKVGLRGRRRNGWQLRNLLATPASCQRSVETDTFFSLPRLSSQVLFFFCVFHVLPAACETTGRGNRRGQTRTSHAGRECPI